MSTDDSGMDLETFVSATLQQIVSGVEKAKQAIKDKGTTAQINPTSEGARYSDAKEVAFDVAITVIDTKKGGGKAGIKIAPLEVGGGKESSLVNQAVSRIRFAVPISMPHTPVDQYPDVGRGVSADWDYDPLNR